MAYSLRRTRDGAGDSGMMSQALVRDDDGGIKSVGSEPVVGAAMRVGSITARSYSSQDWWMTTPITEIISDVTTDDGRTVTFKTGNSEYVWKDF